MTLLADVVTASQEVTDTSSRSRKIAILAHLLARLEPNELAPAVGFLVGVPRQGRIGVGYSTIYRIERGPAAEASLTIEELDRVIAEIQEMTGSGSAAKRRQILGELLGRATEPEADFVKRLFTGGLRQGALAGLMVDAVAKAAGVPGEIARRALMLSGDFTRTAEIGVTQGEDGPAAFQDTVSQIDNAAPPEGVVTFLFDVLHVDGDDPLDTPLEERAARLDAMAPDLRIRGLVTSDPATAQRVLDEALREGHEGIVVKDAASRYNAGRRGKAWQKVKPVRTYDLVVLGAEWGHGRRQGWLSNLHLGARDPHTGGFLMVGKCFKGLTDELLEWQTRELLARETARRGMAVLVRPELVVEIALDGVQASTRYPSGVALRFARVKRYRPDKSPEQADTIDDLRALLGARR